MRLASPVVGLSLFFAALCGSGHAQTPSPPVPASTYDEQAVGVRNLGAANRETPPSGQRPDWMYAEGKWDAFRGPDHHPIARRRSTGLSDERTSSSAIRTGRPSRRP